MSTHLSAIPMRPLIVALLAGGALFGATGALAGECPKDKVLAQPREIEDMPSIGVERETLSVANLKDWRGVGDLYLRTRRLTIAKDGIIPTHSHEDRPALVYIIKGELIEHSSLCAVTFVHRAGEISYEWGKGYDHWFANQSGAEVVLISSDVIPPEFFDPGSEHLKEHTH